MTHDLRMYEHTVVLGIKCILLDDGVSERQPPRWKHALYGMLSSGFVTMGYTPYISALFLSCFGLISALLWSLVCGRLLANLDSHVVILIIYLDVRDDTTICMSIYIYFFSSTSLRARTFVRNVGCGGHNSNVGVTLPEVWARSIQCVARGKPFKLSLA